MSCEYVSVRVGTSDATVVILVARNYRLPQKWVEFRCHWQAAGDNILEVLTSGIGSGGASRWRHTRRSRKKPPFRVGCWVKIKALLSRNFISSAQPYHIVKKPKHPTNPPLTNSEPASHSRGAWLSSSSGGKNLHGAHLSHRNTSFQKWWLSRRSLRYCTSQSFMAVDLMDPIYSLSPKVDPVAQACHRGKMECHQQDFSVEMNCTMRQQDVW